MKSYGVVVVSDSCEPYGRRWLFHIGAYGWTRVLVVGADPSLENALDLAAEWLAAHEPGHFVELDLSAAADELGLPWPTEDEEELDRIQCHAEVDLTRTESGYLRSWEWTCTEDPSRDDIVRLQTAARTGLHRGDEVAVMYHDVYAPRMQGLVLRVRASDSSVLVRLHGGKLVWAKHWHIVKRKEK